MYQTDGYVDPVVDDLKLKAMKEWFETNDPRWLSNPTQAQVDQFGAIYGKEALETAIRTRKMPRNSDPSWVVPPVIRTSEGEVGDTTGPVYTVPDWQLAVFRIESMLKQLLSLLK